jgi:hypothetical protein
MEFVVADVGGIEGQKSGMEMAVTARQIHRASPIEKPAGPSGPVGCEVPVGLPPGVPRDVV